jgi:hypothetical protein
VANFLQQILGTRPASDASEFGYPALASAFVIKNELGQFHLIFGAAADTISSAGLDAAYANAPNGSIYVCMNGTTTKKIAIKFGNIGLKDGSFLFSSAAYATV